MSTSDEEAAMTAAVASEEAFRKRICHGFSPHFINGFVEGSGYERARQTERIQALERVAEAARAMRQDYGCAVDHLADEGGDEDEVGESLDLLADFDAAIHALDRANPEQTDGK